MPPYVFECNGQRFVNHLERFTPEGHKAAEAAMSAAHAGQAATVAGPLRLSGAEVKKPGAKQWAPLGSLVKAGPIVRPACPHDGGVPKTVGPSPPTVDRTKRFSPRHSCHRRCRDIITRPISSRCVV